MRQKVISFVLGHSIEYPFEKTGGIEKKIWGVFKVIKPCDDFSYFLLLRNDNKNGTEAEFEENKIIKFYAGYTWKRSKLLNVFDSFKWCLKLSKMNKSADIVFYNSVFGPMIHRLFFFKGVCIFNDQRGHNKLKSFLIPKWSVDRVYCVSEHVKSTWSKGMQAKCMVVHDAVDIDQFAFSNGPLDNQPYKMIFVGRIVEEKGIIELLQSLSILMEKHEDLKFSLSIIGPSTFDKGGSSEYFERCQTFIKTHSMENFIEFTGEKNSQEISSLIQNSDVYLMPSIWQEAGGIGHLEAFACGTPVISFNVGIFKETIKNGYNGFKAENIDPTELADKIYLHYKLGTEERSEIRKNARKTALPFDYKVIAEKYRIDFKTLLGHAS